MTKKIRRRGFWHEHPKNHPLLMEVQLGKSVDELCEEHFSGLEGWFEIEDVVREIIELNDPNIRFAVDLGYESCQIIALNSRSNTELECQLDYWDDEGNFAREEDAGHDCNLLNEIVCRLFGIVHEKPEAKITDKQYIEQERCPFCLHKKLIRLDDQTWNNKDEMGCTRCGETWYKETKTIVTGFSR